TPFIDEQFSKMEYTPRHAGERVWTVDWIGREYVGGYVFGNVSAQTAIGWTDSAHLRHFNISCHQQAIDPSPSFALKEPHSPSRPSSRMNLYWNFTPRKNPRGSLGWTGLPKSSGR